MNPTGAEVMGELREGDGVDRGGGGGRNDNSKPRTYKGDPLYALSFSS